MKLPEKNVLLLAVLGGCGAFIVGCSPIWNVGRTMVVEPVLYWNEADSFFSRLRLNRLAEKAYQGFRVDSVSSGVHEELALSADFARGFKEGFVNYIYAGGTGQPPPVPPRRYWKGRFQNAFGQRVVDDWYQGYRFGVSAATESGLRETVTVVPSTSLLEQRYTSPIVEHHDDFPQLPAPRPLPPNSDKRHEEISISKRTVRPS